MTAHTATFFAAPTFFARFAALRDTMAEAAAKRKVYRTTLSELENLSSRDLADLGIAPSSLREIAHQAAYGA